MNEFRMTEEEQVLAKRDDAAGNYKRGVLEAEAQARDNLRSQIDEGVRQVKRFEAMRDTNAPGRAAYDRCWHLLRKMVDHWFSITDEAISIPAHKPPPMDTSDMYIPRKLPQNLGLYEETGGGRRRALGVPGSGQDWLSLDGDTK